MKKWWWAVAVGTLVLGFAIGALVGPGYWMSRSGYAKPFATENGGWNNNMMNYMHNQSNRDDIARMMSSPENRKVMIDIMSSPQMRQTMIDAMQQPEMRQSMAEMMSDPKARKAFVDMMAMPQMSIVIEDMAGDTRVRRFMETALQKSLI